jgi:hypothetical protein
MNYKLVNGLNNELVGIFEPTIGCIPINPANTDYANFKKDLADGAELLDSEGNVIDGIAYLATLED